MKRIDLSVGQRLAIGSLVIAILILLLGITVARSIGRVTELRREKTEIIAPRAEAADALETAIFQQAVAFRNYAITGAEADHNRFRATEQQVTQRLDTLRRQPQTAAGAGLLNELVPLIAEHQRSFEPFIAQLRAGSDRETLRTLESLITVHRNRLLSRLEVYVEMQREESHRSDQVITQSIETLAGTIVALTLLILAVGGLTSFFVARSVREPAVKLSEAAEAMRSGSYEPAMALEEKGRTHARFQDELAEAAHVFGRMASTLQRREKSLAAHSRLSAILGTSLDPAEVATRALREVTEYAGAEIGVIYSAGENVLRPAASVALEGSIDPVRFGEGIPGEAAATRTMVTVRDIPPDAPFTVRFGFDNVTPRCVLAAPMIVKGRVVGVLLVAAIRDFDADATKFVEDAAAQIAITLDNASAHVRIAALASQLQENNEKLQAQNEELQAQREELQSQSEELQAQTEELQSQTEELHVQAEELREQQDVLAHTNLELVEAETQKNRFLAVLGHELRNPLAAINSAVALVDRPSLNIDPVVSRSHEVIRRQTALLGRLLDDLLDLARITSGKIELEREPLELNEIVRRAFASSTTEATARRQKVELRSGETAWVDADATRIEQIVTNLLTNAIRYTPPEGEIKVESGRDKTGAFIRVSDTGIGIRPELLPRVFDFLVQGEKGPNGSNGSNGGLGIGLTLVKNLVELHGGTVEAASEGPGRGTVMTVRLPALAGAPVVVPKREADERVPVKRSIVVVEDNEDVRQMLQLLLERAGHRVVEAHDGPSGVAMVTDRRPDFALVDLDLPGFDGCELARRVRRDPRLTSVRLIAISGYGRPEDRERAIAAGFDDHLVKPIDFGRLASTLG